MRGLCPDLSIKPSSLTLLLTVISLPESVQRCLSGYLETRLPWSSRRGGRNSTLLVRPMNSRWPVTDYTAGGDTGHRGHMAALSPLLGWDQGENTLKETACSSTDCYYFCLRISDFSLRLHIWSSCILGTEKVTGSSCSQEGKYSSLLSFLFKSSRVL